MKKKNLHIIKEVLPGSIAEECGMEPGDAIIKINGEEVLDSLDYRYMMADVVALKRGTSRREYIDAGELLPRSVEV